MPIKAAIPGLIVAGGASQRMGVPKPFAPLRGGWLIDAVISRIADQVSPLMLNLRTDDEERYRLRHGAGLFVRDAQNGAAGPLGGIVAGLATAAAQGADWLATFPCDTPGLPSDLVSRLRHAVRIDTPAVAVAGDRIQSLCAVWPTNCLEELHRGMTRDGWRSVWRALDAFGAMHVIFPDAQAFFNINTPADLKSAERDLPSA